MQLYLVYWMMLYAAVGTKALTVPKGLVIGLNKYSHDASCCVIDASTGSILFSQAKERITRKKHDGGAVGSLVRYALDSIGAKSEDITCVVSNNHHFRARPFEQNVPYYAALNYIPQDYCDVDNLLAGPRHLELSHHLAHAWGCVGTAPFKSGLVVVMDGMGESFREMAEDMAGIGPKDLEYMHDLKILKQNSGGDEGFVGVPRSLFPHSGYREAESAYVFDEVTGIKPIFKRWTRNRTPAELYNGGFEDMESMGAVYSRISSHILGDWNACGKVMGLAPWAAKHKNDAKNWYFSDKNLNGVDALGLGSDFYHEQVFMSGNPIDETSFKVNWETIHKLGAPNKFSTEKFGLYANIAQSVQSNLESSAMSLVSSLKASTGQENLALTGGVALNSVLNGRIAREGGFQSVFIPPAPGDEGIAVGCALYGLHTLRSAEQVPEIPRTVFPAYQGRGFTDEEIDQAISDMIPWLVADEFESQEDLIESAVQDLSSGDGIIAWFQGRSEFGQRALGSRSILADPRREELRTVLNQRVKEREWFRPLAPSCLADEAGDWFNGLVNGGNESPYMSITTNVREDKRSLVPAVCHVDGSARLQTVTAGDNSLYHRLISAFRSKTGVPMVLNTSFNRKSQPIVETPADAIKIFLQCKGSITSLYLGNWKIQRRAFPLVSAGKAPSDSEGLYAVFAEPFYLSEQTVSPKDPDSPLRIRIQDGGADGDEVVDGGNNWKDLPSLLHLEILQLLQEEIDAVDGGELLVVDLFEIISQMKQDNEGVDVRWSDVRTALNWLFEENLVHFDGAAGGASESQSLEELFKGANIVDYRGL